MQLLGAVTLIFAEGKPNVPKLSGGRSPTCANAEAGVASPMSGRPGGTVWGTPGSHTPAVIKIAASWVSDPPPPTLLVPNVMALRRIDCGRCSRPRYSGLLGLLDRGREIWVW